jgi:hypothetical protein
LSSITLSDSDLIGKGGRRLVYAFPGDPSRCIKVCKPGKHADRQQQREIKFYRQLDKKTIPTDRISRYHGTVETNRGTGYVYDAIRDADGQVSTRFKTMILSNSERISDYLRVMETIEDYLFDNLILFYDVGPSNIVCRINESGALEPFIVDGLGEVVAIPIQNYSRYLRRRTIRRRWLRLIAYMKRRYHWMEAYHLRH